MFTAAKAISPGRMPVALHFCRAESAGIAKLSSLLWRGEKSLSAFDSMAFH